MPHLRTTACAGNAGLSRRVAWAHVCELREPTAWLGENDLLLTTGIGIPRDATAQRRFVEKLADAGLSGLAIGDRMYAPALASDMLAAADERQFPVLSTHHDVPFMSVVRAVAGANQNEEHAHVLKILSMYETLWHAFIAGATNDLLARLGSVVDCDLYLLDYETGSAVLSGAPAPSPTVSGALRHVRERHTGPIPAVLRIAVGSRTAVVLAVRTSRVAVLLAMPRKAPVDMTLLRHVAALLVLGLEREAVEQQRQRVKGGDILCGLVDGTLAPEGAMAYLAEHGLDSERSVFAAWRSEQGPDGARDLQIRLEQRGVSHLLMRRSDLLLVMLADDPAALGVLTEEAEAATPVGISSSLGRLSRAAEAEREARWALESAGAECRIVRYGENAASCFLPQGLSAAERATRQVLGPLLDYDRGHASHLVKSLRTFLRHNRSWKDAASELQIHKQTLVYRMRRVEQITGRRLDQTSDVAELWFALVAADLTAPLLGVRDV